MYGLRLVTDSVRTHPSLTEKSVSQWKCLGSSSRDWAASMWTNWSVTATLSNVWASGDQLQIRHAGLAAAPTVGLLQAFLQPPVPHCWTLPNSFLPVDLENVVGVDLPFAVALCAYQPVPLQNEFRSGAQITINVFSPQKRWILNVMRWNSFATTLRSCLPELCLRSFPQLYKYVFTKSMALFVCPIFNL